MPAPEPNAAAARADVARLLAACYYEPGPELGEEGVFQSLRDAAAQIDAGMAEGIERLRNAFAAQGLEALLVDYARLFLGPVDPRARPYGSVWLDADAPLMGDSTMAVLRHYEDGGFEVDPDFRDLPDHIAVELEYLYLLLFREADADARADRVMLRDLDTMRRRFLAEQLGAWVPPFAAAVRSGAETAFYRELANLTERFVALERARGLP